MGGRHPLKPWLTWYGDDFTGSVAVLELLAPAHQDAVLFVGIPEESMVARFQGCAAIGVAGTSRARSAEWIRLNLPLAARFLKSFNSKVIHYKTCSTLDSSPTIGSIGAAIDVFQEVLKSSWVPMVHAAPAIGRYQVFGNLFAVFDQEVYRLDRHPVASQHPVTPMRESNVVTHLQCQTSKRIGLINILSLRKVDHVLDELRRMIADGYELVAMDVLDDCDLATVGKCIWETTEDPVLVVGSQGVEYSLLAYLEQPLTQLASAAAAPVIGVSGSASEITERQLRHAAQHGFHLVRFDAIKVLTGHGDDAVEEALHAIRQTKLDCIVYTALGPKDPAIQEFYEVAATLGVSLDEGREKLGRSLGRVIRESLLDHRKRVIVSGGDTSGAVISELQITALTVIAEMVPTSPLCRGYSSDPLVDGIEILLKGGQMGGIDYFVQARGGD